MSSPNYDSLMASLRQAPRKVIHGVVYPSGVGAGKSSGDPFWHMTFSLAVWSTPGGPIQRQKLLVRRDIEDGELDGYRERLPNYGVVALDVGLVENSSFQGPQALLHTVLADVPTEIELFQIAEELRKPATTEDAEFGIFTLDRRINWHETNTSWGTDSVRLALNPHDDEETFPHNSLNQARRLWADQERWNRDIRGYMVKELLGLKNDSWLEENEAEISAEDFLQRISIESISIDPEGSFEFWYDDGDLFWGHSIMVSGSLDKGLDDAGIHG